MGRHSAPDEPDSDGRPDDVAVVRSGPEYRPRRARPDTEEADPDGASAVATRAVDETDPRGVGLIRDVVREPAQRPHRPERSQRPERPERSQRPERPVDRRRVDRAPRDSDETTHIEMVVDPELDAPVPEAVTEQFAAIRDVDDERGDGPAPVAAPVRTGGETDLDLLRGNSAVRARVIAAVLVPFLLYAGVLFGTGAMTGRTFLIWIWVPLVSAGVLAGLILDAAHRRRPAPSAPDVATKDDRAPDEAMRDEPAHGERGEFDGVDEYDGYDHPEPGASGRD